jgi:hypothetical protein
MKSILRFLIVIICVVSLIGTTANAQDLAAELAKVGTANVNNYVGPLFTGFAAGLNSAFYYSADLHDILGFDVSAKLSIAKATDEEKTYDFITPSRINIKGPGGVQVALNAGVDYDAVVTGVPTVVGASDVEKNVRIKPTSVFYSLYTAANQGSDVLFPIPAGLSIPSVFPTLQAAVGLPFGIEVMGRYFPTISDESFGKFSYWGFGLRYDIDQWIPLFPIDIAVHFMTQKMNFKSPKDKDVFSATGTAYGVEISKRLLILTVYGGFQLEKAKFTLGAIDGQFTTADGTVTPFTIPEQPFEGKNKSRVTVGARLLLLLINAHVEYSIAKTPVISAGVGISLR